MDGKIDLDHMDFDYFKKQGETVRKDATNLDSESKNILNDVSEGRNPFDREMPFDMDELNMSIYVRVSIKALKENPEILARVAREVGVDNL